VGIIVVAVASGGLLATLVGIRNSPQWAMNDGLSRVAAVLFYAVDLTGRLATLLFGVAVVCRSRRAWNAAVAYFGIQLINPLGAMVFLPFVSAGLRSAGTPVRYWLVSGYLSTAANGLGALLMLVLLTRPPVRNWMEHWSCGGVPGGGGTSGGERE